MSTLSYSMIKKIAFGAVLDSAAIRSWCLENYGREPAVVNDLDPNDPPRAEDCPLVAFCSLGGAAGQDDSGFVRIVCVRVAVQDDRMEERRDIDGRLLMRDYVGSDKVTDLLERLVYPALCEAFNGRNFPLSTTDETVEHMGGGLFQAKAGLTVSMTRAIGETVPTLG